jgi:hypothetical protein
MLAFYPPASLGLDKIKIKQTVSQPMTKPVTPKSTQGSQPKIQLVANKNNRNQEINYA